MADDPRVIIAIMVFNGAEEMDFVGPWEVLCAAAETRSDTKVLTIAPSRDPVICEKGMRVIPDASYGDVPHLDVLVIPGGSGARREMANPQTLAWLHRIGPGCTWLTSVCTGAFLLVGSGLAAGRRVTTHHDFTDQLRQQGGCEVIDGVRFVRDGNVVTAGGVMSGIEMSLWLVAQMFDDKTYEHTRRYIAYDTPPRTSFEDRAGPA